MHFKDERKPNTIIFEKINVGEVFFVEDVGEYGNEPYMRIFNIIDEDGDIFNAVNLFDGQVVCIASDEEVIKCQACLTVR